MQLTVVETPEYKAVFTNRGAQLISFKLKKLPAQGRAGAGRPGEGARAEPHRLSVRHRRRATRRCTRLNTRALRRDETTGPTAARHRVPLLRRTASRATKTFRFDRPAVSLRLRGQRQSAGAVPHRDRPGHPHAGRRGAGHQVVDHRQRRRTRRDGKLKIIGREKAPTLRSSPSVAVHRHRGQLLPGRAAAASAPATASCSGVDVHDAEEEDARATTSTPGSTPPATASVSGEAFFGPKETEAPRPATA